MTRTTRVPNVAFLASTLWQANELSQSEWFRQSCSEHDDTSTSQNSTLAESEETPFSTYREPPPPLDFNALFDRYLRDRQQAYTLEDLDIQWDLPAPADNTFTYRVPLHWVPRVRGNTGTTYDHVRALDVTATEYVPVRYTTLLDHAETAGAPIELGDTEDD